MASTKTANGATSGSLQLKNRLDESRSPYVRGHMNNPVAWQMWNEESIRLAKEHNRLIFLSIGYAACHWCHVMEHESFENDQVARVLNESFIPIKVDREERPDVDRVYMNFVQATTGSGGWPLNVFLTPELEPVFGGTYWPGPTSATSSRLLGHASFLDILERLRKVWREQPDHCRRSAKDIVAQLRRFTIEGTGRQSGDAEQDDEIIGLDLIKEAYRYFVKRYDKINAGFGSAPKFPTPVNLSFLLRMSVMPLAKADIDKDKECKEALSMATTTLQRMARGGIHDQIGHGFARYSVTGDWSLPHFEKMLYDQAQLLDVYLDAYLLTKDPEMLESVNDIADYLTVDALAAPAGGFHSAEDADSYYRRGDGKKREGAFYVWTLKEFDDILGKPDADICARYWNVKPRGNVARANDPHDEFPDQNVLAVVRTPAQLAKDFGLPEAEVVQKIQAGRKKLWEHRERERPRPNLDDKIVTSWNGLAIGALARASAALESSDAERAARYRAHAVQAVDFIREHSFDEETGKLRRVYREGPSDAWGFADDYAFMIHGLIQMYEATFDESYLAFADRLQKTQIELFWDPVAYGFFSTEASAKDLIMRLKEGTDNAEPSANGISAQNLYRLSSMLDDASYAEQAKRTCLAFGQEMEQHPFVFTSMLPAVVAGAAGMKSLVLAGRGPLVDEAAVRHLRTHVRPLETVVRWRGGAGDSEQQGNDAPADDAQADEEKAPQEQKSWLGQRNPMVAGLRGDDARIQVCEGTSCRLETDLNRI